MTDLRLLTQTNSVHTIKDALSLVSQPQPALIGQSGSNEASQQVQIEVLPPILVLHLERFLYDATADGIVKISKLVQFAPEIEIPIGTIFSFVSLVPVKLRIPRGSLGPEIMSLLARKSAEPVKYKLHGVLCHHGESAGSGNYTVDVLHPNGDSARGEAWLRIDDEAVSVLRHEDVFEGHDNEQGNVRCACMLFYCRTASART